MWNFKVNLLNINNKEMNMKIAILGATSYIATDLIRSFSSNPQIQLDLFSRFPKKITNWLDSLCLGTVYSAFNYNEFNKLIFYDAIINFIGIGSPIKALEMGASIFDITRHYDNLVLEYLEQNPTTKYLFLSSGAVYGGNFNAPVSTTTESSVDINTVANSQWYSKAKLYAELGHRNKYNFNIIDLRVFNYFSSHIDLTAGYFISEILKCIYNKEVFYTGPENIYRDYIHREDFYQLINCILYSKKNMNMPLDCYSKAPIDKITLLDIMKNKFGLCFNIDRNINNLLNSKPYYYSVNYTASSIGYSPDKTSLDCILQETEIFLSKKASLV